MSILFYSCNSNGSSNKTVTTKSIGSDSIVVINVIKKPSKQLIDSNKNVPEFEFIQLTKDQYDELEKTSDEIKIKNSDSILKKGGEMEFKLSNSKSIKYKDKLYPESESEIYIFKGILSSFYVVMVKYYDWSEYLVINNITGSVTKFWSEPHMSKSEEYMYSYSDALEYDIMPNGIQMYKNVNGRLRLDWEYRILDWKPESVKWLNDKTLLIVKVIPNEISKTKEDVKEYMKVIIK